MIITSAKEGERRPDDGGTLGVGKNKRRLTYVISRLQSVRLEQMMLQLRDAFERIASCRRRILTNIRSILKKVRTAQVSGLPVGSLHRYFIEQKVNLYAL